MRYASALHMPSLTFFVLLSSALALPDKSCPLVSGKDPEANMAHRHGAKAPKKFEDGTNDPTG